MESVTALLPVLREIETSIQNTNQRFYVKRLNTAIYKYIQIYSDFRGEESSWFLFNKVTGRHSGN